MSCKHVFRNDFFFVINTYNFFFIENSYYNYLQRKLCKIAYLSQIIWFEKINELYEFKDQCKTKHFSTIEK